MSVRRLSKSYISGGGNATPKSSSFLASYSPAVDEMDLIGRIVGDGSSSSFTFTNIPQTYQHLHIRGTVRGTRAFHSEQLYLRFNSDNGSNYAYHGLYGNSVNALTSAQASTTVILLGQFPAASDTIPSIATFTSDVLDYTSTSKNKVSRSLLGYDKNGDLTNTGYIWLGSGLWINISAITSLSVLSNGPFTNTSVVSLYGVMT